MDDDLTPKQKERLERLKAEIQLDQITVSFSLEERNVVGRDGRKMSVFYSTNVTRRLPDGQPDGGWTLEEARVTGCIVSKHVIETVYRDAVWRGLLSPEVARTEVLGILARYDKNLKRMLGNGDDEV